MPVKFPESILDKTGAAYSLDAKVSSPLWVIRLLGPGKKRVIGYANCIPEGKVLRLMDFHIEDDYRCRGLGSTLLKTIVEAARFHHKLITGVMMPGNLEAYPDLPSWYEQNGFKVNRAATPMTFEQVVWSKPQPGAIAPSLDEVATAVRDWAQRHRFIRRVWLYGSRVSGMSSNTGLPPQPETDWDVAVEVDGETRQKRYERWQTFSGQAIDEMEGLTNWKMDVQHCDPQFHADSNVNVGVLKCSQLAYRRDPNS